MIIDMARTMHRKFWDSDKATIASELYFLESTLPADRRTMLQANSRQALPCRNIFKSGNRPATVKLWGGSGQQCLSVLSDDISKAATWGSLAVSNRHN